MNLIDFVGGLFDATLVNHEGVKISMKVLVTSAQDVRALPSPPAFLELKSVGAINLTTIQQELQDTILGRTDPENSELVLSEMAQAIQRSGKIEEMRDVMYKEFKDIVGIKGMRYSPPDPKVSLEVAECPERQDDLPKPDVVVDE